MLLNSGKRAIVIATEEKRTITKNKKENANMSKIVKHQYVFQPGMKHCGKCNRSRSNPVHAFPGCFDMDAVAISASKAPVQPQPDKATAKPFESLVAWANIAETHPMAATVNAARAEHAALVAVAEVLKRVETIPHFSGRNQIADDIRSALAQLAAVRGGKGISPGS